MAALRNLDGDPAATKRAVVEVLRDHLEADAWCSYEMCEDAGRRYVSQWRLLGDRSFERSLRELSAGMPRWDTGDPTRPPRRWRTRFVRGATKKACAESPFFQRFYTSVRVSDQLRLLVYDGSRFVGWLGGLRKVGSPDFSRRDSERLTQLVSPIRAALVAAQRQELDAPPAELIVDPSGAVRYCTSTATDWVNAPGVRAEIRARVSELEARSALSVAGIAGRSVEWGRLHGGGLHVYLFKLGRPRPVQLAPDHALSPRQREVATLVCKGLSLGEVAEVLGIAMETARSHLKQVYLRLEVSSRAELATLLAARR